MGFPTAESAAGYAGAVYVLTETGAFPGGATQRPSDVLEYGGLQRSAPVTFQNVLTTILAAPAAGYANRLHSVGWINGAAIAWEMTDNAGAAVLLFGPTAVGGYAYLGGLLSTTAVQGIAAGATNVSPTIAYDTVALPYLFGA